MYACVQFYAYLVCRTVRNESTDFCFVDVVYDIFDSPYLHYRCEKKQHPLSDWLRPAFRPADYFWRNAYEIRDGAAGPTLSTSNPQQSGVSVRVGVMVGVGLGLSR